MSAQNPSLEQLEQQAMRDFAARMQDPQIMLEDVRIEEEANCTIGVGHSWRTLLNSSIDDSLLTQTQRQQLRLLIGGEFCQMLDDCDLGAGLSDAIRVGRKLLSNRLKQPSENIEQQLLAALEVAVTDESHSGIPDSACSQIRSVLRSVLSEQDWEAIASAATTAIQAHFRQKIAETKAALGN
ncbi:MAG: hypothetical protein AAFZ17_12650 [Cyanobacteria bacterium J06650_10]